MLELAIAAFFLLATHFGLAHPPVKRRLVAVLGKWGYLGAYSTIAIGAVAWLILAWAAAPYVELWPGDIPITRHLTFAVMPVALILLVSGYTILNPTAVIFDDIAKRRADPRLPGPLRVTRHPVMWAVALWGLAHMAANGDLAAQVFFGSFVVLALVGAALSDRRRRMIDPEAFDPLDRATSFVPFKAIIDGRADRALFRPFGWWRIGMGLGLVVALLWGHGALIGVDLMGGGR